MYKKTITYEDYDGVERTEDFFFNLSEAELTEMQLSTDGGLEKTIKSIIDAKDVPRLIKIFKEILLKSYGQKSADGRRFIKSETIANEFSQTEAYSQFFMELATNDTAASEFIKGIIPSKLKARVEEIRTDSTSPSLIQ